MKPRDNLIDQFSTYALLDGDRVQQWIAEPRLRRNMQLSLHTDTADQQAPALSEPAWALYWYKIWQSQQESQLSTSPSARSHISQQHLTAYLQEACYWTAKKIAQRFPNLECTIADYFQVASSETHRVLKGFNPSYGTNLKGYAPIVLTNLLKDYLRQRRVIDVCSDWSLLRKVSNKRVLEVLENAGVSPIEREQYHFAWTCFKTIYTPGGYSKRETETADSPVPQLWTEVAHLYNSKRQQQAAQNLPSLTPEQLESYLNKLTRWIRAYLYPNVDSLNKIKPGQEQGELQDDLADPHNVSWLEATIDDEIQSERQQQLAELYQTLETAYKSLDTTAQKILQLFYQENLSQQELAARMDMSQPTVSRRLKKAEEALLTNLLDHVKAKMNNLPEPTELKHISNALKEWLNRYFHKSPS
jgi:RNA polymerase sigma factor (sigma-70 family)